jgi:hypothetical protein
MASPFAGIFPGGRYRLIRWQLLGTATILTLFALGFLGVAVDLWLTERIGPPAAAAATAGLLVLTALAFVGIAAIVGAFAPKAIPPARGVDAATIGELAATLIDLSKKLNVEMRSSAKPLTIAALVIGCVVGYSPALQRMLKDLIG